MTDTKNIPLERAKYEGHHETLDKAYDEIRTLRNENKKLEYRLLLLSIVSFSSIIANILHICKLW
jgi:hypothetical protein